MDGFYSTGLLIVPEIWVAAMAELQGYGPPSQGTTLTFITDTLCVIATVRWS